MTDRHEYVTYQLRIPANAHAAVMEAINAGGFAELQSLLLSVRKNGPMDDEANASLHVTLAMLEAARECEKAQKAEAPVVAIQPQQPAAAPTVAAESPVSEQQAPAACEVQVSAIGAANALPVAAIDPGAPYVALKAAQDACDAIFSKAAFVGHKETRDEFRLGVATGIQRARKEFEKALYPAIFGAVTQTNRITHFGR